MTQRILSMMFALQVSSLGAQPADYSQCLLEASNRLIAAGASRPQFRASLAISCKSEEAGFRQRLIAKQRDDGRTIAEAEADAESYIVGLRKVMEDLLPLNRR